MKHIHQYVCTSRCTAADSLSPCGLCRWAQLAFPLYRDSQGWRINARSGSLTINSHLWWFFLRSCLKLMLSLSVSAEHPRSPEHSLHTLWLSEFCSRRPPPPTMAGPVKGRRANDWVPDQHQRSHHEVRSPRQSHDHEAGKQTDYSRAQDWLGTARPLPGTAPFLLHQPVAVSPTAEGGGSSAVPSCNRTIPAPI